MNPTPTEPSLFKEKHSLAIRLWHWLFFVAITCSMVTVLFASTLFTTRGSVDMIKEQVQQKGGVVSQDQARAVAHEYSDQLWNLHKIIGYVLSILLLSRIIIEVAHSKEEKLGHKIKNALRFTNSNNRVVSDAKHYLFVKYGYLIFYILILVMSLTGLGLAYEDVPLLNKYNYLIGDIHSITQYTLYFYILVHLIGVIRADTTKNKGIVSGMIHGNK